MALYTMGDLHLPVGAPDKTMEIFDGWANYVEKIEQYWRETLTESDTIVLAGDFCWGMSLESALPDFKFVEALPGKKILLKGNHDYWWSTKTKMTGFFERNGLNSFEILHNNCIEVEGFCICGSRGWMFEQGDPHDTKIAAREAMRFEASLKAAQESVLPKVAFLHYPPIFAGQTSPEILNLLLQYGITRCYYGHLHGNSRRFAFEGHYEGVSLKLIAADALCFHPFRVDL